MKHFFGASLIVLGLISLSLLRHWEPSGETWGYWVFSRIFNETGRFVIPDRSPLYTLYLTLFRVFEYPLSLIAEYIVSTYIVTHVFIYFSAQYLAFPLATLAGILWIPFFQTSEPPVQRLAFACFLLGFLIRKKKESLKTIIHSYTFFFLAYLFRSSYVVTIVSFTFYDILRVLIQKKIRIGNILKTAKTHLLNIIPLLSLFLLFIFFLLFQSDHPWNTGWFATSKWFPYDGKKFEIIQVANWSYIWFKYGTFKDKDFYFTNNELFNGAKTTVDAVLANPQFIFEFLYRNLLETINNSIHFTLLPYFYERFTAIHVTDIISGTLLLLLILGSWKGTRLPGEKILLLSNALHLFLIVVFKGFSRYLYPMLIVQVFASYHLITRIKPIYNKKALYALSIAIIVFFSNGLVQWKRIAKDIYQDISNKDVQVLEARYEYYNYSMMASYVSLKGVIGNCRGIMTLEHTFIGAFTDIPLEHIYDVWEIPSFGKLGDSYYKGLTPERINCLLVSNDLVYGVGAATNHQIRYDNYILLYSNKLKELGAKTDALSSYGQIVVLR